MSPRFKHSLDFQNFFVAVMRFYSQSFIVKQSLKTIYSIKNYGSLSFACFYHFFKSKSVR